MEIKVNETRVIELKIEGKTMYRADISFSVFDKGNLVVKLRKRGYHSETKKEIYDSLSEIKRTWIKEINAKYCY